MKISQRWTSKRVREKIIGIGDGQRRNNIHLIGISEGEKNKTQGRTNIYNQSKKRNYILKEPTESLGKLTQNNQF